MNGKKSLIGAIFFASGFSSLIYQAAWQRILTLYYSVENISTTLIVTVYMLGLGFGAIIGGRIAERVADRVRLYFFIELAIGLFGIVSIPFMELIGKNTAASGYTVSFVSMFLLLCVPTMLMGITLPLLTKIFNGVVKNFLQSLSYLYFINTLGAALGVLTTSYLLISFWGLDISIYVAVCINLMIAVTLLLFRKLLSNHQQHHASSGTITPATVSLQDNNALKPQVIYAIVFITGFIAIGYEIIWFRMMGTIVKASPYSFSTVLAVYLIGIALGSYLMKKTLSTNKRFAGVNRRELFFSIQVLIAVYVLFSISAYYWMVNHVDVVRRANFNSFNSLFHPSVEGPVNYRVGTLVMWLVHKSDIIVWPAIFILVPTCLMGASFPLVTSLAYTKDKEAGTVGNIYFFNVLGNVAGGLVAGLFLLGAIGTEYSLLILSFIGLSFIYFNGKNLFVSSMPAKTVAIVITGVFCFLFFPGNTQLYRTIHPAYMFNHKDDVTITEGTDGVIVTYENGQMLSTCINGMTHGGRPAPFFFYETIQTLSYKKDLKKVLVIGFGTGTTVEALRALSPLPQVTVAELSEALIENLEKVDTLRALLTASHVKLVCADGRSFLNRNTEKYDAIFMDPLRTTTSFSNNIYSKQFFQLVKEHLTDDGLFMTWADEVNVIPKTLCAVFPHVNMYSCFTISSKSPLVADANYRSDVISRFPSPLKEDIQKYAAAEKQPLTRQQLWNAKAAYPLNEDYRPICEYFIGYRENNRGVGKMFYDHPLMR